MAGIIKNQILKHLSRYVKKLSSDKINVSTLKGEGELTDLELDEEVLTELLELPIWMKIKKAHCNRARLMIQWTKLKSIPIRLVLDTIEIQIEACEELRPMSTTTNSHLTLPTMGKYGFVNKVVDGITVTVESVEIRFYSVAFESKVQISRIQVESKSPQWRKVELTHTRLKDMEKGEVLVFKEIEWQTLRLEAQSTSEKHLAPIRLLTNQTKARVVIKKKLSDCAVVGCRLSLILDDLLWVLTDSQILAAAHFMSSLSGLVKQATEMTQAVKSARKLETSPEYKAQQNQSTPHHERLVHSDSSRIFDAFDVKETSYHLICDKIDLHFCDDQGGGRSNHPDLRSGGAGQVQLTRFMVDFYPYHLAKADRLHWFRYANSDFSYWFKDALKKFHTEMINLFPKSTGASAASINPIEHNAILHTPKKASSDIVSSRISDQLAKLMSTCLVLKIGDICMYKVTTFSRETPIPFLSSYMERPKDICAIHMEFTSFYYAGAACFPLPSPKFYTQVHPLQIHLDVCTILWLNSFITNIQTAMPQPNIPQDSDYVDLRLELIMPKVVYEEKFQYPSYKERPRAIQIQASRIIISNYRSSETGTAAQLQRCISEIEKLADSSDDKIPKVSHKFIQHSKGLDKIPRESNRLPTNMLWTEARDVLYISVDTVWADFCIEQRSKVENGENEYRKKFRSSTITSQSDSLLLPFLDSVPLSIWLHIKEQLIDPEFSMGMRKDIQALFRSDGMINAQLTHQQYLFLLRAIEVVSEISLFLTIDTRKTYIVPRRDDSMELIGCLPRLEVSLILPYSELPPENSSMLGEVESVVADPLLNDTLQGGESGSDWKIPETKLNNAIYGLTLTPESPKKFYNDLPPPSPNLNPNTPDNIKSSLSGLKQGLPSSLLVSFTKGGGHSTPDSEVTSLWSTDSSENNFITLDPEIELMHPYGADEVEDAVEVAEEVIEDNSQSTGSFSIHNPYGKEDTVEICQNSEGLSSSINFNCKTVSVDECRQIPWKEFQTLFATRGKKWNIAQKQFVSYRDPLLGDGAGGGDAISKTDGNDAIKVKFVNEINDITFMNCITSEEMTEALSLAKNTKCPRVNLIDRPEPESPVRKAIAKSTHPHLEAKVDLRDGRANEGQFITLHNNILKSATEFFEDEIPPVVLPMELLVVGADVEILEDRGPNFPPTKVRLQDTLRVVRDEEGVFSIGHPSWATPNAPVKLSEVPLLPNGERGGGDGVDLGSSRDSEFDLKQKILALQKQIAQLEKDKSALQDRLRY